MLDSVIHHTVNESLTKIIEHSIVGSSHSSQAARRSYDERLFLMGEQVYTTLCQPERECGFRQGCARNDATSTSAFESMDQVHCSRRKAFPDDAAATAAADERQSKAKLILVTRLEVVCETTGKLTSPNIQ